MNSDFDKLPPHSIDAEKCLLGALMLIGNDVALWAESTSALKPEHFYRSDNALIFAALKDMRRIGKPVDAVTLREFLMARGSFEEIGGLAYVAELLNSVPSAANAKHYAGIVRNCALGRALLKLATDVHRDVFEPGGKEFSEHANRHAARFTQLAARGSENAIRSIGEGAMEVYERAVEGRKAPLISTGFASLDREIGGFPIGGFSIIGGRPGMGKSAMAKAVALNLARAGTPVGLVSVEETITKVSTNILSNVSDVDSHRIAFGRESREDLAFLLEGVNSLHSTPMFIADYPSKISEIESTITLLVQRYGCKIVFVDHIHIVNAEAEPGTPRAAQLVQITCALKAAAKQNNVAVVGLAQLNRGAAAENAKSRKPTLWDLKESGSLEENGDLILAVHREDYYRAQKGDPARDHQMIICILKNKLAGPGETPLYWDADHQRLSEWEGSFQPELPL